MTNDRMANDELPEGWVEAPFSAVTVDPVQRVPAGDEEITYIDIGSVDRVTKTISEPQTMVGKDAPSRARKVMKAGDVLVSTVRPNLNAVALVDRRFDGQFASTGFDVLRSPVLDPRWIFFSVRTPAFVERMTELVQGALYPAVRSKDVRAFTIPIAPLAEQKRIADKLEAVLGRVDACRARLDRVPDLLKRFRQSVLAAATSGQLTEDWRANALGIEPVELLIQRIFEERGKRYEAACQQSLTTGARAPRRPKNLKPYQINRPNLPDLPSSWQWVCWDDLTDWITYGFTRPMPHVEKGVPIITAKNVRDGFLDFSEPEQTTPEAFETLTEKDKPRRDEILITKDGAIRGRAALVETDEVFCISQAVAVLRFGGLTGLPKYLLRVIQAKFTQDLIEEESSGMAMPHLSITNFGRFPVPFPPLAEQAEIVRRVEALFALADRIEARLATAQRLVERLTPATLSKAFRGDLVPQDPNDEPASKLLERVRAVVTLGTKPKRRI